MHSDNTQLSECVDTLHAQLIDIAQEHADPLLRQTQHTANSRKVSPVECCRRSSRIFVPSACRSCYRLMPEVHDTKQSQGGVGLSAPLLPVNVQWAVHDPRQGSQHERDVVSAAEDVSKGCFNNDAAANKELRGLLPNDVSCAIVLANSTKIGTVALRACHTQRACFCLRVVPVIHAIHRSRRVAFAATSKSRKSSCRQTQT